MQPHLASARPPHASPAHRNTRRPADYDLETPWYTVFIASREAEKEGFYIPEPIRQTTVPIGVLSGIFLLLSGLDHLFTVLPGVNRNYNAGLQRNQNPYRWLEYSGAPRPPLPPRARRCRS